MFWPGHGAATSGLSCVWRRRTSSAARAEPEARTRAARTAARIGLMDAPCCWTRCEAEALYANELTSVVDAGADGGEEDEVSGGELDVALRDVLGEEDERAGGRRVAVAVDVEGHLLRRDAGLGDELEQHELVGLVQVVALDLRHQLGLVA